MLEAFPEGRALHAGFLGLCPLAVERVLAAGGEDCQSAPGAAGAGQEAFAPGEKRDPSFPGLLPRHSRGGGEGLTAEAGRGAPSPDPSDQPHLTCLSMAVCAMQVAARQSASVTVSIPPGSLQGGSARAHLPAETRYVGRARLARPEPSMAVRSALWLRKRVPLCHRDIG